MRTLTRVAPNEDGDGVHHNDELHPRQKWRLQYRIRKKNVGIFRWTHVRREVSFEASLFYTFSFRTMHLVVADNLVFNLPGLYLMDYSNIRVMNVWRRCKPWLSYHPAWTPFRCYPVSHLGFDWTGAFRFWRKSLTRCVLNRISRGHSPTRFSYRCQGQTGRHSYV